MHPMPSSWGKRLTGSRLGWAAQFNRRLHGKTNTPGPGGCVCVSGFRSERGDQGQRLLGLLATPQLLMLSYESWALCRCTSVASRFFITDCDANAAVFGAIRLEGQPLIALSKAV